MFLFILRECTDFNKAGHYRFTKSDLTPGEKRRISPRFDLAPGVSPVFLQDSTTRPARGPIFLQDSTARPVRAGYSVNIQSTCIR